MKAHKTNISLFFSPYDFFLMVVGALISAFAINIFFIPNNLIDGGTVGLSMIASRIFGGEYLPLFLIAISSPFVWLAYRFLGKPFVIHMALAVCTFSGCLSITEYIFHTTFQGNILEVVVIGGAMLGTGVGLILRSGGCLDGTEILGIIFTKTLGFTVGQVVFFCNVFIFTLAGIVFQDWHPPLMSLITFLVVVKTMDFVLVGLDETKSVLVISSKFQEIEKAVMHNLGLGLTIMYGRSGFSGESKEILYIIVERLQLAELKELIFSIDPKAFLAIENLHEVSSGKHGKKPFHKSGSKNKVKKIFHAVSSALHSPRIEKDS